MYTVKQVSDMAGVSVRTLHYYDEIGLLTPSHVGDNGYRYYRDEALLRLQQILFFRELDLSLQEIAEVLGMPTFDLLAALEAHRDALQARIARLQGLIKTVDGTILHITGETKMSEQLLFSGFNGEEEQHYKEEARQTYGAEEVDASYKRWNRYSAQQKEAIYAEGGAIYADLATTMETGPASADTQQIIARWHAHLRHFYEPTVARMRGLGQLYKEHPGFARNIGQFHAGLPAFMREAIEAYCDNIEEGS